MEDELQGYRVMGLVARSCLEKGLQNQETYSQHLKDDRQRASTMNLFWTIFTLDKQWGLATGQPSTIHESVVDSGLPRPVSQHGIQPAAVTLTQIGRIPSLFDGHGRIQSLGF